MRFLMSLTNIWITLGYVSIICCFFPLLVSVHVDLSLSIPENFLTKKHYVWKLQKLYTMLSSSREGLTFPLVTGNLIGELAILRCDCQYLESILYSYEMALWHFPWRSWNIHQRISLLNVQNSNPITTASVSSTLHVKDFLLSLLLCLA